MSEAVIDFNYVNLANVDPTMAKGKGFSTIPAGFYTVQIRKAGLREKTYQQGPNEGSTVTRPSMTFAIVDNAEYSGRLLFADFNANAMSLKDLRKIADVTGIQQEEGQSFEDWLNALQVTQPTFRTRVIEEPARDFSQGKDAQGQWPVKTTEDGEVIVKNQIRFREATPATA